MFSFKQQMQKNQINQLLTKTLVFLLSFSLTLGPSVSYAQNIAGSGINVPFLNLPVPGSMVLPTSAFVPVLLKGMTIHPEDSLKFDFILDSGNTEFGAEEVKKESEKLIKYFLASLTVPQDDLWVNLSPYEKDRIIPEALGKTELGKDMLAQDYILKQLTASLMYPESELGKSFWERIYERANKEYGTSDIPMDTFNKVWIVPDYAVIYENGDTVYIVESKFKVMLESDYLAARYSMLDTSDKNSESSIQDPESSIEDLGSSKDIIKQMIIPEIEKEVNEGKNFAPLRQIYHSLILAKWYKEMVKRSLLTEVYLDQNKIEGIDLEDKEIKEKIYAQYMEAYKKGVYDYIKEEYDPASQEIIPRKYFSGGLVIGAGEIRRTDDLAYVKDKATTTGKAFGANVDIGDVTPSAIDHAMLADDLAGTNRILYGVDTAGDAANAAYAFGVSIRGNNRRLLLDTLAKAVGVTPEKVLDIMIEEKIAFQIPDDRYGKKQTGLEFTLGRYFYLEKRMEAFRKKIIASSSNRDQINLPMNKLEEIFLNAVDVDYFISYLTKGDQQTQEKFVATLREKGIFPTLVAAWELKHPPLDRAMITDKKDWTKGGIDMNTIQMQREGPGIDIKFNPVQLQEMMNQGVSGFIPTNIHVIPINSIFPLLGLEPMKPEEKGEFEVSILN